VSEGAAVQAGVTRPTYRKIIRRVILKKKGNSKSVAILGETDSFKNTYNVFGD
jgi:hypothetical protein